MASTKVLICIVLGLLAIGVTVDALCGSCSTVSYAMCLNETAFKVCFDGVAASEQVRLCPDDHICTAQQGVCKPRGTVATDCGVCNICMNGFACISQTQFEYCQNNVPMGIVGYCPTHQYCSLSNLVQYHTICVASCNNAPTCYGEEVIATPSPEPDYSQICEGKTDPGYYENTYDSTCKTYVYCEEYNGTMTSVQYQCTSGYFSQADKKCIATKPSKCT